MTSPKNLLLSVASVLLLLVILGCRPHKDVSPMQQDQFVEFTSHLGTTFVAPSQWTTTDEGDTFSLRSPDGQAVITATVFTAEGSGSLDDFRKSMLTGLKLKEVGGFEDSEWTAIHFGDVAASKLVLIPSKAKDHEWRLYVVDRGKYYHAVFLCVSAKALSLNGDFYESVVCTFQGMGD